MCINGYYTKYYKIYLTYMVKIMLLVNNIPKIRNSINFSQSVPARAMLMSTKLTKTTASNK